jgi:hypothetical protein
MASDAASRTRHCAPPMSASSPLMMAAARSAALAPQSAPWPAAEGSSTAGPSMHAHVQSVSNARHARNAQ